MCALGHDDKDRVWGSRRVDSLFGTHGLPLYGLVRVLSTTCWTATVEVLLDMVVAEAANLDRRAGGVSTDRDEKESWGR